MTTHVPGPADSAEFRSGRRLFWALAVLGPIGQVVVLTANLLFRSIGLDDFPFDLPNFSSPKSIAITVLVPMTSALVTFTLGKGFHTSAFLAGLLAASQAGKLLGIAAAFKTVVDSGAFDGVPSSRTAEVYAGLGFALGPATVSCIASVVLVALLVPRWHVRYYLFIQRERRKSRAPIADKTS